MNKASTATSVVSPRATTVSGQSVTFTATVSIVSPGSNAVANPTGTVTFYDNGVAIGTGTLSGTGHRHGHLHHQHAEHRQLTRSRPPTPAATATSTPAPPSTAISQVVNKASHDHGGQLLGQPVGLRPIGDLHGHGEHRQPGHDAVANPTGTVNFYDGTTLLGSGALSGTGTDTATFTTSTLSTASHQITAMYAGNTNFNSSTSAAITQTVNTPA